MKILVNKETGQEYEVRHETKFMCGDRPSFCNLDCQFKMSDEGQVSSEQWDKNFNDSVAEFSKRRMERFAKKSTNHPGER